MDQKNSSLYFLPLVIGSFIDDTKQLSNKETLLYLDLIIHEWQQLKRDRYLTEVGLEEIKTGQTAPQDVADNSYQII